MRKKNRESIEQMNYNFRLLTRKIFGMEQ